MSAVKETVEGRIERGAWILPSGKALLGFIQMIKKISRDNMKFATAIQADADVVGTFPLADVMTGNQNPIEATFLNFLSRYPRADQLQVVVVKQLRGLYQDGNNVYHETILYSPHGTQIQLPLQTMDREPLKVSLVEIPGPTGCKIYILPPRNGVSGQHLTVCPGITRSGSPRLPSRMRDVANAMEAKLQSVDLGNGDVVDFGTVNITERSIIALGYVII
jgi:hypothetical protein